MNIGQTAGLIGASAKTIRYWGQIGLLARARGTAGGGRVFSQLLRLIRRGRDLGVTIEWALILLQLWRARSDADAGIIARRHVDALKRQITDMQAMACALEHLASTVKSDARSDGPPLDDMAEDKTAMARVGRARTPPRDALRFAAEKPALARWRTETVQPT